MSDDAAGTDGAGVSEGLGAARELPKWVLYDRTESMVQSIASDVFTFGGLLVCIWFSHRMGGGVWEFVTLLMFTLWTLGRLPWDRVTRTTKLRTKAEAKAWAESLPEDRA